MGHRVSRIIYTGTVITMAVHSFPTPLTGLSLKNKGQASCFVFVMDTKDLDYSTNGPLLKSGKSVEGNKLGRISKFRIMENSDEEEMMPFPAFRRDRRRRGRINQLEARTRESLTSSLSFEIQKARQNLNSGLRKKILCHRRRIRLKKTRMSKLLRTNELENEESQQSESRSEMGKSTKIRPLQSPTSCDLKVSKFILDLHPSIASLSSKELRLWSYATDIRTLRLMFGSNQNKFWGDLDNESSRRLYHTLLPRAMVGLYRQGLEPDELAFLAFEARKAAKQYARERSQIPGRIFAIAYDGFRHLKNYGSWSSDGLSWEEIWFKYEQQVKDEILEGWDEGEGPSPLSLEKTDLYNKIYLKILERSCITNEQIDRLVIGESDKDDKKLII